MAHHNELIDGVACTLMRGGTSKGTYFLRHDVPQDPAERDAFVGRRDSLSKLQRRFDDGARLVSVLGIGGTLRIAGSEGCDGRVFFLGLFLGFRRGLDQAAAAEALAQSAGVARFGERLGQLEPDAAHAADDRRWFDGLLHRLLEVPTHATAVPKAANEVKSTPPIDWATVRARLEQKKIAEDASKND